ncbi:sirohydrochlorin cobaltochelatase [Mollicutes bacterium LVI A0039]|nr:sirohydrochlorin cobaltochelatase [Mollicutes bacterium LVI A0039]
MIICVYHGSSFKEVNESQTAKITAHITAQFPEQEVIECYYSSHVLKTMERRQTPLLSFKQALTSNYHNSEIYVLITNLMNGEEFQNILKTVDSIDVEQKVKHTNFLLSPDNISSLASAVVDKSQPTLFIGHGNDIDNSDYKLLNDILKVDHNYVTTLKANIAEILENNFPDKNVCLKPLMITSAYHAKRDIELNIKQLCEELGYTPNLDLTPLALNVNAHKMFENNLKNLMEK